MYNNNTTTTTTTTTTNNNNNDNTNYNRPRAGRLRDAPRARLHGAGGRPKNTKYKNRN